MVLFFGDACILWLGSRLCFGALSELITPGASTVEMALCVRYCCPFGALRSGPFSSAFFL